MTLLKKLNQNVLSLIYEYDSTYKNVFREPKFAEELLLKSWNIKIDHLFKMKKIKKDIVSTNDNDDYDPAKTYIIQLLHSFISRHLFIRSKNIHKKNILNYIKLVYLFHLQLKELNYKYNFEYNFERFALIGQLFDCPFYDKDFQFKYYRNNTKHCYYYNTKFCYYYNNVLHNDLIKITFIKGEVASPYTYNPSEKYTVLIENLTKNRACCYSS